MNMNVSRTQLADLLVALGTDSARDWDVQTLESNVNDNGILFYSPSRDPGIQEDLRNLLGEIFDEQMGGRQITVADDAVTDPCAEGNKSAATIPDTPIADVEANIPQGSESDFRAEANIPQTEPHPAPERKPASPISPSAPKKPRRASRRTYVRSAGRPRKGKYKPPPPPKTIKKGGKWEAKLKQWKKHPAEITGRGPGITQRVVVELEKAGRKGTTVTKDMLVKLLKESFPKHSIKSLRTTLDNLLGSRLRQQYGLEIQKTQTYDKNRRRGYWIGKSREKSDR
jgi:hypothetical protein